jgi:hypothetical protein
MAALTFGWNNLDDWHSYRKDRCTVPLYTTFREEEVYLDMLCYDGYHSRICLHLHSHLLYKLSTAVGDMDT